MKKVRYRVRVGKLTVEVDEFEGDNAGLVLAEIEYCDPPGLTRPDDIPDWLGDDITEDHRYSNLRLAQTPYRSWA